ncbi:flavodoxin [Marinomonas agarivorans]|nr:flavodoxin [Marinomonas agarivorans]
MSLATPIAIIYGTDTNNTEEVANKIAKQWSELGQATEIFNISDIDANTLTQYDFLILGIPTWDFGGIQSDWEDLENELTELDLKGKLIALYGLGDQFGYADYFLDAMGWMYEKLQSSGATFIGQWSTEGYDFTASRACINGKDHFIGLGIDEDQQFELTDERVEQWVIQLYAEMMAEME